MIKFCPNCRTPNEAEPKFCRSCGIHINAQTEASTLNGRAIAKFIIGDAFVLPAVLLIALDSPIQSILWILLAVPGVLLYTWAVADLVKAGGIKRKRTAVTDTQPPRELGAPMPADMPIESQIERSPSV